MLTFKQNDTLPVIEVTMKDGDGVAVDLSSATEVLFRMINEETEVVKVDRAATITDAPNGVVQFTFQSGDTDTAGRFQYEFQITFSGGGVLTFPNDTNGIINIVGEIE